jgi:hypothetical protein
VKVGVEVGVSVGVSVGVFVGVKVGVGVGVSVGVLVGVKVGVEVGVSVGVLVGVRVGVEVGVSVGVLVGVKVGVGVGVSVGVLVGVRVDVEVGVSVGVLVGVKVGVEVGVSVGVFVGVKVGVGGARMVRVALAAVPVNTTGPLDVGASVVFVMIPGVELVTNRSTAQLAPAAREAAANRTFVSPAVEGAPLVFVTVPQDSGVKVKVVFCRVKPTGKVSSSCTVVNEPGLLLGFVKVSVKVVLLPPRIEAAPNALVTVGGMNT